MCGNAHQRFCTSEHTWNTLAWRHFIKRLLCGIHGNKQISYWFNTFSLMRAYVVWWWEKWVNQSAFIVRDTHCMHLIAFINNAGRVQWTKSWYSLCCVHMHSTKSPPYRWPCKPLTCVTDMCIQKELRNQLEPRMRCSCNSKTNKQLHVTVEYRILGTVQSRVSICCTL